MPYPMSFTSVANVIVTLISPKLLAEQFNDAQGDVPGLDISPSAHIRAAVGDRHR